MIEPQTPTNPHRHSLGHFLCIHPLGEPFEDIDRVAVADLKQDACLRALIALHRAGKPLGPADDPVAAFDAEPKLVMRRTSSPVRMPCASNSAAA